MKANRRHELPVTHDVDPVAARNRNAVTARARHLKLYKSRLRIGCLAALARCRGECHFSLAGELERIEHIDFGLRYAATGLARGNQCLRRTLHQRQLVRYVPFETRAGGGRDSLSHMRHETCRDEGD